MRKRWVIVVASFGAIVALSWILLRQRTVDPYPFLAHRQPVDISVWGPGTWELRAPAENEQPIR